MHLARFHPSRQRARQKLREKLSMDTLARRNVSIIPKFRARIKSFLLRSTVMISAVVINLFRKRPTTPANAWQCTDHTYSVTSKILRPRRFVMVALWSILMRLRNRRILCSQCLWRQEVVDSFHQSQFLAPSSFPLPLCEPILNDLGSSNDKYGVRI